MIIEINKDIEEYKESVFFGFSAKQFLSAVLCLIVGTVLVLFLKSYIGLKGAAYVTVPVVSPIALSGFYSLNGMSFFEVMKRKFHFAFGNRALTYVSKEEKKMEKEDSGWITRRGKKNGKEKTL